MENKDGLENSYALKKNQKSNNLKGQKNKNKDTKLKKKKRGAICYHWTFSYLLSKRF